MAIMVILLTLIVPGIRSLTEGNDLTRGGQMVNDQISLARQVASARNITVEIRLFETYGANAGYGAIQLWVIRLKAPSTVSMVALDKVYNLPSTTAISENPKLSQLLATLPAAAMMTEDGLMKGKMYVAFQIKPQGSVNPIYDNAQVNATAPSATGTPPPSNSIMAGVYLTVVPLRFAGATLPGSLPTNYVTVQANPYTGTPLIFRP